MVASIFIEEHQYVVTNILTNYGLAPAMVANAILIVSVVMPPCVVCQCSKWNLSMYVPPGTCVQYTLAEILRLLI